MRAYHNPFQARASEQQRDLLTFLRHFAVGVLGVLPDEPWDRLVVLRSAPGGGKTSLMRLFTTESLSLVNQRRDDLESLASRLTDFNTLDEHGPKLLGVLLNLSRDYRSFADVGAPDEIATRLFFRLLDARIMVSTIRAALHAKRLRFPDDVDRFEMVPRNEISGTADAASRVGGTTGIGILEAAADAENEILDVLDALLPVDWGEAGKGHADLYSLRLLSDADIYMDSLPLNLTPVMMFDDGHQLSYSQRQALFRRLTARDLQVGRWYSERFEVLDPDEVFAVGEIEGRDYVVIELENEAKTYRSRGGRGVGFAKILLQLGDQRAGRALETYAEGEQPFSELLEVESSDWLGDIANDVSEQLRTRGTERLAGQSRYERVIEHLSTRSGYTAAVNWRVLEILATRDALKTQQTIFDEPLDPADLKNSNTRHAAALFLAQEFSLPYYAGSDRVASLSSYNIEQFLSLCGDLFEEVLARLTLHQAPRIPAERQDRIIRIASKRYWQELPRRIPHGHDVQRLVGAIANMGRTETYRPNAPYAPGVTGTALSMRDRQRLLDDQQRARVAGGDELRDALASAVAYNVLGAELDRSVKGGQYMVLYINRLLCPASGLPLNRGGFRERSLETVAGWVVADGAATLDTIFEQPPLAFTTDDMRAPS